MTDEQLIDLFFVPDRVDTQPFSSANTENETFNSAESCERIAKLWDVSAARSFLRDRESALWCADCWRTMSKWRAANPNATKFMCDLKWTEICQRAWGEPYRIIGGLTTLQLMPNNDMRLTRYGSI